MNTSDSYICSYCGKEMSVPSHDGEGNLACLACYIKVQGERREHISLDPVAVAVAQEGHDFVMDKFAEAQPDFDWAAKQIEKARVRTMCILDYVDEALKVSGVTADDQRAAIAAMCDELANSLLTRLCKHIQSFNPEQ